MQFKDRLKYVRKQLRLTQAELARQLHSDVSSVNKWENGVYEPQIRKKHDFDEFCKLHGIDFDWLSEFSRKLQALNIELSALFNQQQMIADRIKSIMEEVADLADNGNAFPGLNSENLICTPEEANEELKAVRNETAKEILDELDKYLWDDIDCTSDFTGREHNATVKQLINIIKKKYSVEVEE